FAAPWAERALDQSLDLADFVALVSSAFGAQASIRPAVKARFASSALLDRSKETCIHSAARFWPPSASAPGLLAKRGTMVSATWRFHSRTRFCSSETCSRVVVPISLKDSTMLFTGLPRSSWPGGTDLAGVNHDEPVRDLLRSIVRTCPVSQASVGI